MQTGGEPSRKRIKMASSNNIFLSCFDEPDRFVAVDGTLLESSGCRLWLAIKNSTPQVAENGTVFYSAGNGMTRGMLITMCKSLALGELILSKGVTLGEALTVFRYEGIHLTGGPPDRVSLPTAGVAFSKRDVKVNEALTELCNIIADAIVQWPRLETVLGMAMSDGGETSMMFTATATRVWLRFVDKPKSVTSDGDAILALATQYPRWLTDGLVALGMTLISMGTEDAFLINQRDEKSFNRLWRRVEHDPLGHFFALKTDFCKTACDDKTKKRIAKAERFAAEVRHGILHNSPNLAFYRAAVMAVDYGRNKSPVCSRVFNGACADDASATPERNALKKALKARGVSIIRWSDTRDPNVKPLVFPPSWRDKSGTSSYGPSVLLSFENVI